LGCDWHGKRKELSYHIKNECQFACSECPNLQCSKIFLKCELEGHLSICPYNTIICKHCEWSGPLYKRTVNINHDLF